MTTLITTTNFSPSLLSLVSQPLVSSIVVTNSSYVATGATAVDLTGGYITITGTGFLVGATVYIDSTIATSVTFVSSTQLNVQIPAMASNTYVVYVVNTDGSLAIRVNGVTYSSTPNWVTGSSQSSGPTVSIQLTATSDSTITYTLASGSTLPSGLTLSSTGLLSGTLSGTSTVTYNFSVVATDLETQTSTSAFSVTVTFSDPYFMNVGLLLNGETSSLPFILDASTNNFAITVNGDTKATLATPYADSYYSNYFDGASWVLGTLGTSVTIGTSDFCFEAWGYWTSFNFGTYGAPLASLAGATAGELMIRATKTTANTTTANFFNIVGALTYIPSSMSTSGVSVGTLYLNRWHHLAIQRVSGTWYFYVDGVMLNSTSTGDASLSLAFTKCYIGNDIGGGNGYMAGNVSNVRLVVGSAPYATAGFTPPTVPLTNITNTKFLSAQSNRYIDNSVSASVFTTSGSPRVSPVIPFTPNSSYSTYGSAYFDGNGDFLAVTPGALGSGNYTIELWLFTSSYYNGTTYAGVFDTRASGSDAGGIALYYQSSVTNLIFRVAGTNIISITASTTPLDAWNHVAIVRNSGTITLYINGAVAGSAANSTNHTNTTFNIGKTFDPFYFIGYISNFRMVYGSAVYTSAFTPSTTPLTAISNTQLLTCQYNGGITNSGIIDNGQFQNVLTRFGNSSQGSFSPYSQTGWSNYFNGTSSQWISFPAGANTAGDLGSGDFTLECWTYLISRVTVYPTIFDNQAGAPYTNRLNFYAGHNSGTTTKYNISVANGSLVNFTTSIIYNAWTHIALVRTGSTIKLYVNGALDATTVTSSASLTGVTTAYIGGSNGDAANCSLNGYVSNFRIVKGTAVYTTTFTPSTTPLTAIAGTTLLTSQSNRFIDNGSLSATITTNGTPSVQAFSPFGSISEAVPISYSNYFDGTGDYLYNSAFVGPGSGNFTAECWIYPTAFTSNGPVFKSVTTASSNFEIRLVSGKFNTVLNNTLTSGTATLSTNTWYHLAMVRNGTTLNGYVNGVLDSTATNAGTVSTNPLWIGSDQLQANFYSGYISNLRIVIGTAIYTSAFTPPTSPLTAVSGTNLLTCQSTTMIDNSTSAYVLTATGDIKPSRINPFGYTTNVQAEYSPSLFGGSMVLDGTGDYVSATNPMFAFGATNDFTAECWVYFTTVQAAQSPGIISVANVSTSTGWQIYANASGWGVRSNSANVFTLASPPVTGQWYHVAYVRKSGTHSLYVNGVRIGTSATSYTWSDQVFYSGYTPIGQNVYGYISDVRLTNGTAIYSSNFVPPTRSLTNYSTTIPSAILLNFTNGGIVDQHSSNVLETSGNAQLSTNVKKYGNASMYFDGTGDYLYSSSPLFFLGTSDFTIECWVFANTGSTNNGIFQISATAGGFLAGNPSLAIAYYNGNLNGYIANSSASTATSGRFTANTWHHLAVVRSSSVTKLYLDGILETTVGTAGSIADTYDYTGTYLIVGGYYSTSYLFNGYIDDFRITRGYARYTSTFTPPGALIGF